MSRSSGPPSRLWVCEAHSRRRDPDGLHRNARLGLPGRRALVADVEAGCSCREAARCRGVSQTTACKWWRRWSEATLEQRRSLVCLEDRSSRPRRYPRLLAAGEQERICAVRRRSG
ncbi:MAG: leucine zipper domain-containing protein [Gaiellaceae bacterium]